MNNITIHNYEAFLLDFSEGNLTGDSLLELEVFMIDHPELGIELDAASISFTDNETIFFNQKQNLKKTSHDLVTAEQFINYIENTISFEEKILLEKSCRANPTLAAELLLYKNTIAIPDFTLKFHDKKSLKRKPKIVWFNFAPVHFAAAASVAFAILLYVFWPSSGTVNTDKKIATVAYPNNLTKNKLATLKPLVLTSVLQTSIIKTKTQPLNKNVSMPLTNIKEKPDELQNDLPIASDTLNYVVKKTSVLNLSNQKNVVLAAQTSSKTIVEVITYNVDEPELKTKKKGFWSVAGKALKSINKAGLKSVNGEEENASGNNTYALTLGNFSIRHHSN